MTFKPGSRARTSKATAILSAEASSYGSLCEDDGGEAMQRLVGELHLVGRSMAADNARAALDVLGAHLPVTVHKLPSALHVFQPGRAIWGELLLRGRSVREVLITCDIGHASPDASQLSGIVVAVALAQRLRRMRTRHSYRFVFVPISIGAVSWLALNQSRVSRVRHSLVLDCLGDAGKPSHQKSHRGDVEIDRAVAFALKETGEYVPAEALSADDGLPVEPKSLAELA